MLGCLQCGKQTGAGRAGGRESSWENITIIAGVSERFGQNCQVH